MPSQPGGADPVHAADVELRDVVDQYPGSDFRLEVPALHLRAGEHAAIVGPSGSGKTTLLHLMAGIRLPRAGTVRVGKHEWARLGDAQRRAVRCQRVGLVFQEFALIDYLDVGENVLLPYHLSSSLTLGAAVRARAESLVERVGLAGKWHRRVTRLSQGERQRVALCRALLPRPSLLLADEPTGNLDPHAKRVALELIVEAARETGATLVLVTHDVGLLDAFERVVDMKELTRLGGLS